VQPIEIFEPLNDSKDIIHELNMAKFRKEEKRGVGELGPLSSALGGGPSSPTKRPGELEVHLLQVVAKKGN
jgi:hypothetical protein